MATYTSAPIGSTGQSLDGVAVDTPGGTGLFREALALGSPDNEEFAPVNSTLGLSVNVVSTVPTVIETQVVLDTISTYVVASIPLDVNVSTPVSILGTSQVFGTVSSQIISSIPFYVAQSSAPWDVNISGTVALRGTSQVFGTVSTQIVSSVPILVSQSTTPWNVSFSGTSMVNVVSTVAQNVTVVANQITSSIPFFVAQSSGPWFFVETVSSNAGVEATTIRLVPNLNTTVVKAGKGNLYGYAIQNMASTALNVKLCNASSAVIASTAKILYQIGLGPSSSAHIAMDMGVTFSTGITMFTTRESWPSGLTAPLSSTATVTLTFF